MKEFASLLHIVQYIYIYIYIYTWLLIVHVSICRHRYYAADLNASNKGEDPMYIIYRRQPQHVAHPADAITKISLLDQVEAANREMEYIASIAAKEARALERKLSMQAVKSPEEEEAEHVLKFRIVSHSKGGAQIDKHLAGKSLCVEKGEVCLMGIYVHN